MRWGAFVVFFSVKKVPFRTCFCFSPVGFGCLRSHFLKGTSTFFSGVFFEGTFDGDLGKQHILPLRILILAEEQMRIQNSQSEFLLLEGWMSAGYISACHH